MIRRHITSLGFRLSLVVFLAILPVFGFLLYQTTAERDRRIQEEQEDALRSADLAVGNVSQLVGGTRQLLTSLACADPIRRLDAPAASARFRLMQQYSSPHLNLGLVLPDGQIVASALPLPGPVSISTRSWFQRLQRTRSFSVGEYQIGKVSGKPSINITIPLPNQPDGQPLAAVYAAINLSVLQECVDLPHLPPQSTLSIVDRNGTCLARNPDAQWSGKKLRSWAFLMAKNRGIHDQFEEEPGLDGVVRLYRFVPVPGSDNGLFVGVGISKEVILAECQTDFRQSLSGLSVMLILALCCAWFIANRYVLRHIHNLTVAARKLAAGEWSSRADTDQGARETRQLGQAFNDMAGKLQQHQTELEEQVRARTAELSTANQTLEKEIAERRLAEAALVHEQHLMHTLMENLPDTIFFKDAESKFIGINQALAERLALQDPAEAVGKSDFDFFDRAFAERTFQEEQTIMTTGKPIRGAMGRVDWPNHSTTWKLTTKMPLRDTAGRIIGTFGISHDITERQQEEEVQRSNSMRIEAILRISQHKAENTQDLLDFALNEIIFMTASKIGYIFLHDEKKDAFLLNRWSVNTALPAGQASSAETVELATQEELWGEVARQRKAIIINDTATINPLKNNVPPGRHHLKRFLSVPVFANGRIVAIVGVANKEAAYDVQDLQQLMVAMDTVWKIVERNRSELELEKLALVVRNSGELVNLFDMDGQMIFINETGSRLVGIAPEEVGNHLLYDMIADCHLDKVRDEVVPAIRQRGSWNGELKYHNIHTGALIDVHAMSFVILNPVSGKPQYLATMALDISERKRGEEALREAEETYRSIFENSVEGMYQATPDGKLQKVNPSFARLWGYASPEEMITMAPDVGMLFYADPDERGQLARQLIDESAIRGWESRFVRRDGSVFWGSVFARMIRDAEGKPVRHEGIVQDITEKKRAEWIQQARNEMHDQLSAAKALEGILGTMMRYAEEIWPCHKASLMLLDESGRRFYNVASAGVPESYLQAIEGLELGPVDGANGAAVYLRGGAAEKHSPKKNHGEAFRMQGVHADGCACWFEPVLSSSDELLGLLTVYSAIPMAPREDDLRLLAEVARLVSVVVERSRTAEERRRLYEQARRDAQTKAELLKEVNHRVKNNLTAILGLVLGERKQAPEEGRRQVDAVLGNLSNRIRGLLGVHQLLSDSQWEPVRATVLADRIIRPLLNAAPAGKKAVLAVSPSPIEVSPRQAGNLAMVFNELATNSLKHALAERTSLAITVSVSPEDNAIRIEYRDDGPGYPPEVVSGSRSNVGMRLIRDLVTETLRGSLMLATGENGGAVTTLYIKTEMGKRT